MTMAALCSGLAIAQDSCPRGTIPSYNAASETTVCLPDPDAPCPPGQTPTYNAASERIVCIGTGGSGDGSQPLQPQSPCPGGQVQLQTDDGSLRCVELTVNPILQCIPPDRTMVAGACVWTCGAGTHPDEDAGRCVCLPGMIDAGLDEDGHPTCRIDTRATIPVEEEHRLLLPQPGERPPLRQ